ncbi:MAG: serine/threonine protein kinase, partial [Myxococcales bacterium]|nr:serine/threonine protein kinase [Myxococcales bacterium]
MSAQTPGRLGQYEPTRLLATGGSAQIWLATDDEGNEVALKVARTDQNRPALLREAQILSTARHPGIVQMLDAGEDGRWIALERVRGLLMDDWARDKPPEAIVKVAFELVEALEHLHSHGVIHGDLKPSNVIIDTEGRARLLDLGIASFSHEAPDTFKGTLGYAAPELLRREQATEATDIYGLGAMLYTCLTGRTPFVAPDPAALTYLPLVSLPAPPS